jgi:hypothetical protein
MRSRPGILTINWAFQGMLGMDRADLLFKIGLDVVLWLAFGFFLSRLIPVRVAVVLSLSFAHTLNWILNTHFYATGRYVGITSTSPERILSYTGGVAGRVQGCPALLGAAVFGAISRGEGVRTTSDVDMRFIRRPGRGNGLRAAWFTFMERARSFFAGFPLDLYLLDDLHRLEKMRPDEQPILLYDPDGVLQRYYAGRGYEWLEPQN